MHSAGNKLARLVWAVVWAVLFRPTPKKAFFWRRWVLQAFGANLHRTAVVFPSVTIWAPWNLTMGPQACLAWSVDCYNVAPITLEKRATVSQRAVLCAATHDPDDLDLPLRAEPITVGASAWVCAEAFVMPGVVVGEGAVLGARALAVRDVPPWTVAAGNPAKVLRDRRVAGEQRGVVGIAKG